jgi:plastocyanin
MRRLFLLPLLLAFATPAPAQEWRMAPEYDVLLTSYDISPEVIHLKAGEPVRLRFVNNSHQSHDFSARAFFRSARLRVPPLSALTIALVPQSGRYRAGSRNRVHRLLGFTGTIIVE